MGNQSSSHKDHHFNATTTSSSSSYSSASKKGRRRSSGAKPSSEPPSAQGSTGSGGSQHQTGRESPIKGPYHPDNRPELTEEQTDLLLSSWSAVQDDIAKVGVVMFIGLFETHPDVQEVFLPFRGLTTDELKQSALVRAHALRVMGTVEKALARINEPEKLVAMLHNLGRKHSTYNVKVDFLDLVGPQFIFAIKPSLEEAWSSDVEDAWMALFKFVAFVMGEAMLS